MRVKDLKSLVWLYRWYNGRCERLFETLQANLSAVMQLAIEQLGGTPQGNCEVVLGGFTLIVSPSPDGLALESITPPGFLDGEQLMLFDLDWDDEAEPYCDSVEGAKHEVAYQ